MKTAIYTIGHDSRSREMFLQLLAKHGVEVLVDVRRWPISKTAHFQKDAMSEWLREFGIEYLWLGDKLGGFRRAGYSAYTSTEAFKLGVEELLKIARSKKACIMCLEIGPKGCHRRFISSYLKQMGWEFIHIISKDRAEYHSSG